MFITHLMVHYSMSFQEKLQQEHTHNTTNKPALNEAIHLYRLYIIHIYNGILFTVCNKNTHYSQYVTQLGITSS